MNRIKKVSRPAACLLALLLCVTLLASTAFAAGGALGADRNGTPYTYVIGYMYSGSSQTVNTREIFTSPNNYDIWLCPVCGRDPLGNSQGTALSPNLYMPCYGYDIAAAGGDMSIRYALVRHRHNNGQLSDDRVYIPVNVPMYAGCYYGYDLTEPAGVQVSASTGWQRDSAVVRFSGGTDTGTSLTDLACTLLSILFAALVWLRGKKDGGEDADDEDEQVDEDVEEDEPRGYAVQKTVNAVLAVLSVVLFFLTQPLVWRFRFVDWWTVLFVLLCGTALAMLIWRRRSESATEEDTAEE